MSINDDSTISLGKLAQAVAATVIALGMAWIGSRTVGLGEDVAVLKVVVDRHERLLNIVPIPALQGIQGLQGLQGLQGFPGAQGSQGVQGLPGNR